MNVWNRGERTDSQAIAYCREISRKSASTPSASATDLLRSTVAKVEPSATVTTRSNALSLLSVRLPEIRSSSTSAA